MSGYDASGSSRRACDSREGAERAQAWRGICRATISGYTLLEIVVVLIIVGILAAVLAPRFIGSSEFAGQTTADQFLAAARYAETLAQNQDIATSLTVNGTSFSVRQNGSPVPNPTLSSQTFVVNLPNGVTLTPATTVTFQRETGVAFPQQGLPPNRVQTFTIGSAGPSVTVYITPTGYVYACRAGGPCP